MPTAKREADPERSRFRCERSFWESDGLFEKPKKPKEKDKDKGKDKEKKKIYEFECEGRAGYANA